MTTNLHLWLIPLLPLAGAALNGLLGRGLSKRAVAIIGVGFPGAAFAWALVVASRFVALPFERIPYTEYILPWIAAGSFQANIAFYLDQLSLVMLLVVTGVGLLIHVYSVGYMEHEGGYYRFFAYLNLFMFFMLMLILADNYLLMFVGWEGVGLASYLLIGFFFLKQSAANAGKKAFIVNRVGDFGFLLGMFLLIRHFDSLNFADVFKAVSHYPVETAGAGLLTAISLLLMVGATGKSAQLPLYVWLPDAMEGPTPVSALIHAATMVTAGIYMIARSNPLFSRSPIALTVVAVIGCLTAIFAATIGMTQTDIKRVLAYSTISQLGYMFMACGVAAYSAGIFHLMTHAFFKALLFLCAGSVIHALSGEQDMRRMGGLRKQIPWTFWTMTAGTFAIAGFPPLAGFFSKDEILWKAWSTTALRSVAGPALNYTLWTLALLTAGLTSFYMFRLWFLTFFGEFRGGSADAHGHGDAHASHSPHESPGIMLGPLVLLAILSVFGGWAGVPHALGGSNRFDQFLAPVIQSSSEAMSAGQRAGEPQPEAAEEHAERNAELALTAASVGVAAIGFGFAWLFYFKRRDLPARVTAVLGGIYDTVRDKYYVDELYHALFVRPIVGISNFFWRDIDVGVIDATVNGAAHASQDVSDSLRRMQSGNIRSYAGWIATGAALVIVYMIWLGAR
ncbi:MAG: NADH-quinone oxidoreductase subunit L [Candidatus Koribacter versatilis]|uniref:NADH-quinone oxidoreductase subunit L n=1 Tax=Candidatus Korobacter versatilis TaxID=658062 RepID=A0A932A6S4_9BACT|nr:NADH-quinone oxidoreductase subunit L [Candidatus Koribacter versatilis]